MEGASHMVRWQARAMWNLESVAFSMPEAAVRRQTVQQTIRLSTALHNNLLRASKSLSMHKDVVENQSMKITIMKINHENAESFRKKNVQ